MTRLGRITSRITIGALFALIPVASLAAITPITTASAANNTNVYVGYVDANRGWLQEPAPWDGSPNTTFEGCSPSASCAFDGGAVRFANNSGGNVNVDFITVNIGGCVFDLWPHNVTVATGSQLIATQTISGADAGCSSDGHLDGSDVGPGGIPYAGNCTPDGVIPTVTVSVDGTATTFNDSAQVLNTGGVDQASCSSPGRPQGNEAAQWQLIGGTQVCSAASLTLAPPTQSEVVGGTASVTASLVNNCGQPLQSNTVTFTVKSGPNTGVTGSAVTDSNGNATFSYSSSVSGADTVEASVTTSGGTFTSNDVTVNWDAAIAASGLSFAGTEGNPTGSVVVATFTDADTADTARGYTATINWGDSSSSSGAVSGSNGSFSVSGNHTYVEEASYTVSVTITDNDTASNTATISSTASIGDAALSATCGVPALILPGVNGATATFTDAARPSGTLSDFSASIDWGDGSSSTGTVSGLNGGPYTVSGAHAYSGTGMYTVTTSIVDAGGSKTSTTCKTLVYAFPRHGTFVLGDKTVASAGTSTVNWWGSQWAKNNALSGGSAPNSMKGFAEHPSSSPPVCGGGYRTDPGEASEPPDHVPSYMAVVVSSQISKSHDDILGDIRKIVIVKTDPGYRDDPGHRGTGVIVATVCG